jgi:hypothetical protein
MGYLANPLANGSCPSNCSCSALFWDVIIHRTCNSFSQFEPARYGIDFHQGFQDLLEGEVSPAQLSCDLDCSLPLPPCVEYDTGQHIKAAAQSFLSIALASDATVLMPSYDDEEAPYVVPVKENPPCIQER